MQDSHVELLKVAWSYMMQCNKNKDKPFSPLNIACICIIQCNRNKNINADTLHTRLPHLINNRFGENDD